LTDLCLNKKCEVEHARFDPPVPRGYTLHDRLLRTHGKVEERKVHDLLMASLNGEAPRVGTNGLGFDISRIGSMSDFAKKFVDPIVEVLAFFALSILPVRGSGRQDDGVPVQRGWVKWSASKEGRSNWTFLWPAWSQPLDHPGIDALLDAWTRTYTGTSSDRWKKGWTTIGVNAGWRIVPYKALGQNDTSRGFGSERL